MKKPDIPFYISSWHARQQVLIFTHASLKEKNRNVQTTVKRNEMTRIKRWNGELETKYVLNTFSFRVVNVRLRHFQSTTDTPFPESNLLPPSSLLMKAPGKREVCASSRPISCSGSGEKIMNHKSFYFSVISHESHPLAFYPISPSLDIPFLPLLLHLFLST